MMDFFRFFNRGGQPVKVSKHAKAMTPQPQRRTSLTPIRNPHRELAAEALFDRRKPGPKRLPPARVQRKLAAKAEARAERETARRERATRALRAQRKAEAA